MLLVSIFDFAHNRKMILKGLEFTTTLKKGKVFFKLGSKLVDIPIKDIEFVCDMCNEEQTQLFEFLAKDKFMDLLFPLPGVDKA
jgi:hypothetical protein